MSFRLSRLIFTLSVALLAQGVPLLSSAQTLSGAGSSAAAPVYQAWATAYSRTKDFKLGYDPVGSTAGLKKIRAREVGFGASDVAPSTQELARDELILVPTFVTGAVPVVNLPRVGNGKLRLSAEVLAGIFLGEITRWNAPEIQRLNSTLALPDLAIKPVVRSDGSGTTYYFTEYLSKLSPAWKDRMGAKTALTWPASFIGTKGSDGEAKTVKDTVGAIGYIDLNYLASHGLSGVQLRNAAGEFVAPGVEGLRSAIQASAWFETGDFHASLANLPGKASWPIPMGSFILLPRTSDKSEETAQALRFFVWALLKGDQVVEGMSFVHLPGKIQSLAFKALSSVTDRQGKALGLEAWNSVSRQ
ncbi:MAG: phosphate ABC transporter substrate-binding protein PstS [Pseudomonadota bacterium]|nr:phosphate ABC transporter substrate-binding protein PstS [Pseudomonadota bacterium]